MLAFVNMSVVSLLFYIVVSLFIGTHPSLKNTSKHKLNLNSTV